MFFFYFYDQINQMTADFFMSSDHIPFRSLFSDRKTWKMWRIADFFENTTKMPIGKIDKVAFCLSVIFLDSFLFTKKIICQKMETEKFHNHTLLTDQSLSRLNNIRVDKLATK